METKMNKKDLNVHTKMEVHLNLIPEDLEFVEQVY